jgi:ATP-dependent DNA helicase RecQ
LVVTRSSGQSRSAPVSDKAAEEYFDLFEQGMSIDDVANQLDRTADTVSKYLAQYLRAHRITDIDAWVAPDLQTNINAALGQHGHVRLKPIFEHLGGLVDYARIRIVATVWEMQHEE